MSVSYLDKLETGFRFGIGGLGDILLLLSSFYDDESEKYSSIVFWANDKVSAKKFFDCFSSCQKCKKKNGLDKIIIFEQWQPNPHQVFKEIVSHKNFKGKAHIPDELKFVEEWTLHADKYLSTINKPFKDLTTRWKIPDDNQLYIGLMPFGSHTETWKQRTLSKEQIEQSIKSLLAKYPDAKIKLFGSEFDKQRFALEGSDRVMDLRGREFSNVFTDINSLQHLYSVDTWVKTFAGLAGIPTTIIKSRYLQTPKQKMGVDKDPSDNIFLDKKFWGFDFITVDELTEGRF